jgi:endonuclease YncB( thermonuclease family)
MKWKDLFRDALIEAECVSVYDGDTCTLTTKYICVSIGGKPPGDDDSIEFKLRLAGINTAEMRGPYQTQAVEQRDFLREKLLGKSVFVRLLGFDKYGRFLGKIYLTYEDVGSDASLNDYMLDNNVCGRY